MYFYVTYPAFSELSGEKFTNRPGLSKRYADGEILLLVVMVCKVIWLVARSNQTKTLLSGKLTC